MGEIVSFCLLSSSQTNPTFQKNSEKANTYATQDLDKDDHVPEPYRLTPVEEVHASQKKEKEKQKRLDGVRQRRLRDLGFEYEHSGEAII